MTEHRIHPEPLSVSLSKNWLGFDRWIGYILGFLVFCLLNPTGAAGLSSFWGFWAAWMVSLIANLLTWPRRNRRDSVFLAIWPVGFFFELIVLYFLIIASGGLRSPFFLGYVLLLSQTALLFRPGYLFLLAACAFGSYLFALLHFYQRLTFLSDSFFWIENLLMLGLLARLLTFSAVMSKEPPGFRKRNREGSGQAYRDPLTGLNNYSYLQRCLSREIERARKDGDAVGLILADIDDFRKYNESFGFHKGDDALRQIADLIRGVARNGDVVGRWGDDEFCIICPRITPSLIMEMAHSLRRQVENYGFEGEECLPDKVLTLSVGVALYPQHATTACELSRKADDALYRMQLSSRNQVQMYSSVMEELRFSLEDPRSSVFISSVQTLIMVINARDQYTYDHCQRVAGYAAALAQKLNLSPEEVNNAKYAGFLHDLGKIEIGREILNKRDPLTEEERRIVKMHPTFGVNILESVKSLSALTPAILHHHERYDGTGYPGGLKNGSIPLLARILAVADSFDAMMSHRPYGEAKDLWAAIEEVKRCEGTQFDPLVVRALIQLVADDGEGNLPKILVN